MKNFCYILGTILIIILVALGGWWTGKKGVFEKNGQPLKKIEAVLEKPLEKYTIENLAQTEISAGKLTINEEENLFEFEFNPNLDGKTRKKATGQINIPEGQGKYPLVLMLRGYVDQEIYETGIGTHRAAEIFAENGFLTLAPDFLGYGGSDSQAEDIFEARFQTYVLVLSLLKSLDQIKEWNGKDIFLWGHSNGGVIALFVLEVAQTEYPTTLWAPVSKPFPYSILYYTDESEDKGKYIRQQLAQFETLYDVEKYSLDNYLDRLKGPIQIHQGCQDDAVPCEWNAKLAQELEKKEIEVKYNQYPGSDHNLRPDWNLVVNRDLEFFEKNLKN